MNEELIFSKNFLTHFCKEQIFFSSNQPNRLDTYTSKSLIEQLKSLNIDNLHQNEEKIAFWINLYNGLLLYLIQMKKITDSKFSLKKNLFFQTFSIGCWNFSLNQIAKGILLNNIKKPLELFRAFRQSDERRFLSPSQNDPRILFALSSGSSSGPEIQIYDTEQLNFQLSEAERIFSQENFIYDIEFKRLAYSPFYKWFQYYLKESYLSDPQFRFFHRTELSFNFDLNPKIGEIKKAN